MGELSWFKEEQGVRVRETRWAIPVRRKDSSLCPLERKVFGIYGQIHRLIISHEEHGRQNIPVTVRHHHECGSGLLHLSTLTPLLPVTQMSIDDVAIFTALIMYHVHRAKASTIRGGRLGVTPK